MGSCGLLSVWPFVQWLFVLWHFVRGLLSVWPFVRIPCSPSRRILAHLRVSKRTSWQHFSVVYVQHKWLCFDFWSLEFILPYVVWILVFLLPQHFLWQKMRHFPLYLDAPAANILYMKYTWNEVQRNVQISNKYTSTIDQELAGAAA